MGTLNPPGDYSSGIQSFLASLPVLEGLGPSDFKALGKHSKLISVQKGESLLNDSGFTQTLYVVLSGVLDVFGRPELKNPAARLVPGDVFAEAAYQYSKPRITVIRAAEDSRVISIPISAAEPLLVHRPAVRTAITKQVAWHLLRMHLATAEMFGELENSLFCYVADNSRFVVMKRGDLVMKQGEKADCMYIVARGSVEIFQEQPDGSSKSIELLRDGVAIGELALLLNEPRSASVRAWRDSLLVRVSGECVEDVFRRDAAVTLSLARSLGERLKRTTASGVRAVPIKTLSIVPWVDEPQFADFCRRFQRAFETAGKSFTILTRAGLRAAEGIAPGAPDAPPASFYAWLADQESLHEYVVCRCERDARDWNKYCNEQADLVLFVCSPKGDGPSEEAKRQVEDCRKSGARTELVLLQPPGTAPQGTAKWIEPTKITAHHHVTIDDDRQFARLVRRITGEAWGLVLSGGGARGIAHIGVIQALLENNIPIDWVGGTSMGAIIGAQYAMGLAPEEMLRATRKAFSNTKDKDHTFPIVSIRSGASTVQRLRAMYGDRQIEDFPINYFCVTCNLTRAEVSVHETGPAWVWVRVSCSIPGLVPPFPHNGELYVDGGFLQNLPVESMKQRCNGRVIASDVSVAADLTVSKELEGQSSWNALSHIARRLRKQPVLPDIFRIMMRTAELSIVRDAKVSGDPTELYIHPPMNDVGISDFENIDRIVDIGREYATQRLKEWKAGH
jgi:predicted acylesterase/phospholipase RssA/CRP-like cAMP-binding protein